MKRETRSYFEMLLYAAFESSTYRVVQSIRDVDAFMVAKAYDSARTACRKLGYFCKIRGGDARASAFIRGLNSRPTTSSVTRTGARLWSESCPQKSFFEVTQRANVLEW